MWEEGEGCRQVRSLMRGHISPAGPERSADLDEHPFMCMLQCRCSLSPDGFADACMAHPPPSVKPVCTLHANSLSPDGVADSKQLLTRHHTNLRQGRAEQKYYSPLLTRHHTNLWQGRAKQGQRLRHIKHK